MIHFFIAKGGLLPLIWVEYQPDNYVVMIGFEPPELWRSGTSILIFIVSHLFLPTSSNGPFHFQIFTIRVQSFCFEINVFSLFLTMDG